MRVLTVEEKEDSLLLRSECTDFPKRVLRSERFRRLADRMTATVTDPSQDGVGIAGPQVGIFSYSLQVTTSLQVGFKDRCPNGKCRWE